MLGPFSGEGMRKVATRISMQMVKVKLTIGRP
jgi:hypothetical protein